MTNTYITLNPLGSSAPKDLFDNASNFDEGMNSTAPSFNDRFGKRRQTWAGAEYEWQQMLVNSGFEPVHLTYVDGTPLVVSRPTQLFDRAGLSYRIKLPASFPVTLTGTWATDQGLVVEMADSSFQALLASQDGADYIGTILDLAGAQYRLLSEIVNDRVTIDGFGDPGTPDDSGIIQAALDSGAKKVVAVAGRTYRFNAITMSTPGQCLYIEPGAILESINPTAKAVTVSGEGCSIMGGGTIKGQPVFDGANVRPTYATVWVTGDYFRCQGMTFDTTPKEAIMFEESTYHQIIGNTFIGRYPQASYNENTTTNHCAIMSNIPDAATKPKPFLNIVGNTFQEYIQGILSANYGAAANNTGVTIVGNTFKHCWDHGVYMSRGIGHNITGNNFLGVRRPIVSDGIGSVVCGNVLMAGDTAGSNREQVISVRESSYSVISNNVIYGYDASILVDCLETTTMNGNLIANNDIRSTGGSFISVGIRLGTGATECDDNTICGNKIHSGFLGTTGAGIELIMASGFANRTRVFGNDIRRIDAGGFGMNINRHSYSQIFDNSMVFSGVSASPQTTYGIYIDNSTFPLIESNKILYLQGGTNVGMTGINVAAGCSVPKIWRNSFMCTSPGLTAFSPITSAVVADILNNLLDPNVRMSGTFTWPTGVASVAVSNANINTSSKVVITPKNVGAAAVMRDLGFFVTLTAGGFSITTAASVVTASSSDWDYVIH